MDWNYIAEHLTFVNLGAAILLPVALMVLDFATGFINACIKHERSSSKMREGGGKKFAEFTCICVALLFVGLMGLPHNLAYVVSGYICFMEVISIAENVKKLGMPIPGKVEDKMDEVKHDLDLREDKKDKDK